MQLCFFFMGRAWVKLGHSVPRRVGWLSTVVTVDHIRSTVDGVDHVVDGKLA
jgi:hypothetical protein